MSVPGFDDSDMENSDNEHGNENRQVTEVSLTMEYLDDDLTLEP